MQQKLEALKQLWPVLLPFVLFALGAIVNGLLKYTPNATGVITALRILLDALTPTSNANSPKSIKLGRSMPPGSVPMKFPSPKLRKLRPRG